MFSPSFFIRCPDKTFLPVIYRVTNGVPRGLYSRVAVTPLASSPWPAHAIYLSRLRDSSLSLSRAHSHTCATPRTRSFLLAGFRAVAASARRCIIRAAKPFLDQLSRSTSLPGIFLLRARELRAARISLGSGSSQFTRVSVVVRVDVPVPILVESRIILPRPRLCSPPPPSPPNYAAARFAGY